MSFGLIVERRGESNDPISVDGWRQYVAAQPDLRLRTTPWVATNPVTMQEIVIQHGEADSEVFLDGEWLPFLRYSRGKLVTEYQEEFEDSANAFRTKIVHVARAMCAVICTDLGDEDLDWSLP